MSILNLTNIRFSYPNTKDVLFIESLTIDKSEKVFLYGKSGSGKSTLLNIIAGVTIPESGRIMALKKDLTTLSTFQRDQFRGDHIGYIFQSFNLISYLTIKENIILPIMSSKFKRKKMGNQLDEEVKRLTEFLKIDHLLNKKVNELSVGQQQRVAVARAFIGKPDIIIADEPTSSLDEDVTNDFMDLLIQEHNREKFSLIFVSHDKRLEKFFDRSISLSEINKVKGNS